MESSHSTFNVFTYMGKFEQLKTGSKPAMRRTLLSRKKQSAICRCGSEKEYLNCCGRYILGEAIPLTAEALMRSRYTAYTLANIAYIQKTMCGPAASNYQPAEAEKWAKSVKWKRLKILESFPNKDDENRYYVKFTAYYVNQGRLHQLQETSEFHRVDGRWFYVNQVFE